MQRGDHRRAVAAFERAVAAAPDNPGVYLQLGLGRAELQDWDGALDAYRHVLQPYPRLPADKLREWRAQAHNNIGNVHFRRGEHEQAAEAYRAALELEPDYMLAAFHLGWIARQLNRSQESEQAFSHCLSLRATSDRERERQADARFYLGALRFRARDYGGAASLMEQVLTTRPEHLEAHYYLGQCYVRLGRREDARRHLEIHRKLVESQRSTEPVASGGIR